MGREDERSREPVDTLRGLTAPGPSKVGVEKAMRARDVSRPAASASAGAPGAPAQSVGASGRVGRSPKSS